MRRGDQNASPTSAPNSDSTRFTRILHRPPNTGDKLRSGARVLPRRRGHSAAPSAERRLRREGWCRRKLRQLHPLVGRRRGPVAGRLSGPTFRALRSARQLSNYPLGSFAPPCLFQ